MAKQKKNNETKCNICGLPGMVTFEVKDEETGAIKIEEHYVPCTGHIGVHPQFWNRHPDYQKFRKFREKQDKRCRS